MLVSEFVLMNITPRNRRYYFEKGYLTAKNGEKLLVDVEDIPMKSDIFVNVKCDYCGNTNAVRFGDFNKCRKDGFNKDACRNCYQKKILEVTDYRVANGIKTGLTSTKYSYWWKKENIYKEVDKFIKKNGYIGNKNDITKKSEATKLWNRIMKQVNVLNLDIEQIIKELGYNIEELRLRRPNGYLMKFEEMKTLIDEYVEKHGHFPSQIQLSKDLKIRPEFYRQFGTLKEFRRMLGYSDEEHLVDNRGFINSSKYELIVANYLIAQGIPYTREEYPFKEFEPDNYYRSDFTFHLDNEKIHLEVWGGMKTYVTQNEIRDYEAVMNKKKKLYKKYKITLIEIEPLIFYYSIDKIKEELHKILSPYLNLPFKNVEERLIRSYRLHNFSDQKIFDNIMELSDYENVLPSYKIMRSYGVEYYYKEILKRYGSIETFAKAFGVYSANKATRSKKVQKIPKQIHKLT